MEKKIYNKKSEKVSDFLLGFLFIPIIFGLTLGLPVVSRFVFLAETVTVIYLGWKRRYIGMGLLFALVVMPLLLFGTCWLVLSGRSISGVLFKR